MDEEAEQRKAGTGGVRGQGGGLGGGLGGALGGGLGGGHYGGGLFSGGHSGGHYGGGVGFGGPSHQHDNGFNQGGQFSSLTCMTLFLVLGTYQVDIMNPS